MFAEWCGRVLIEKNPRSSSFQTTGRVLQNDADRV